MEDVGCNPRLFNMMSVLSKGFVSCLCHSYIERIDQVVHVYVVCIKQGQWSKFSSYHCFERFCYLRILQLLKVKPDSRVALFADLLKMKFEGHHH